MNDETTDLQAVTSGTVADLKDHLDTVQTPEELEALRQAEEDGKARPTALAAIDAKADDLPAGDADPMEVATNHPQDLTDEQIATISGTDRSQETPNLDAAETLERQRDEAKGDEPKTDVDPASTGTIFHGQGGGFGL